MYRIFTFDSSQICIILISLSIIFTCLWRQLFTVYIFRCQNRLVSICVRSNINDAIWLDVNFVNSLRTIYPSIDSALPSILVFCKSISMSVRSSNVLVPTKVNPFSPRYPQNYHPPPDCSVEDEYINDSTMARRTVNGC